MAVRGDSPHGQVPHEYVGPEVPQIPTIESEQVGPSQQLAAAQPAQPTTREVVVNFSPDDLKKPTMELVLKALGQEGLKYENVNAFSSSLPGDENHPKLGTFTRNDSSGNKFTCFQGDMTFSINATDKDRNKVILKFTQTIETSVRVPIHGDNREVKDAMMKALFKLEGYRQHIEEPLLTKTDEKIQDLSKKQFLTIAVVREEQGDKATFYNKTVRWEKHTLNQQLYTPTDCFKSSIMGVKVEGEEETKELKTLWTKEPTCDLITDRDKALTKIVELTKGDHPERANTQIQNLLSSTSQTMNSALTVVVRNTLDNMDDLQQAIPLKEVLIEGHMKKSKEAQATADELGRQISGLQISGPLDHDGTVKLENLQAEKTSKLTEATTNREKAASLQNELTKDLQSIKDSISAVKTLLTTDGISLSSDAAEAKKIKSTQTSNLRIMERTFESFKLEQPISEINRQFPTETRPQRPPAPLPEQRTAAANPPAASPPIPQQPLIELEEVTEPPRTGRARAPDPAGVGEPRIPATWTRSQPLQEPRIEPSGTLRRQTPRPQSPSADQAEGATLEVPARVRRARVQPVSGQQIDQLQSQLSVKTPEETNLLTVCTTIPDSSDHPLSLISNFISKTIVSSDETMNKIKDIDFISEQLSSMLADELIAFDEKIQTTAHELQTAVSEYETLLLSTLQTEYQALSMSRLSTKEQDALLWKPIQEICENNSDLADIVYPAMTDFNDAGPFEQIQLIGSALEALAIHVPEKPATRDELVAALTQYKEFLESQLPASTEPLTPPPESPPRAARAWPPISRTSSHPPATAPAGPIVRSPIESESHFLGRAQAIHDEFPNNPTLSAVKSLIDKIPLETDPEKKLKLMDTLLKTISEVSIDADAFPETNPKLDELKTLATEHQKILKSAFHTPKIINEIITTEQAFQQRMRTAVKLLDLINKETDDKNPTIANALKNYQALSNAVTTSPIQFNNELGENTPATIAAAYNSAEFKLYLALSARCLEGNKELTAALKEAFEKKPKLKDKCNELIPVETGAMNKLDVNGYMIVPVQRIMKHPDLIGNLQAASLSDDLSPQFNAASEASVKAITDMNMTNTQRDLEKLILQIDKKHELYVNNPKLDIKNQTLGIRDRVKDSKLDEAGKAQRDNAPALLSHQINEIAKDNKVVAEYLFLLNQKQLKKI